MSGLGLSFITRSMGSGATSTGSRPEGKYLTTSTEVVGEEET
jgi:hypothetical protein